MKLSPVLIISTLILSLVACKESNTDTHVEQAIRPVKLTQIRQYAVFRQK